MTEEKVKESKSLRDYGPQGAKVSTNDNFLPWENFAKLYERHQILGHGSYGEIQLITERKTGKKYVAKIQRMIPRRKGEIKEEIKIHLLFNQAPQAIQLLFYTETVGIDPSNVYMVFSLANCNDLFDYNVSMKTISF